MNSMLFQKKAFYQMNGMIPITEELPVELLWLIRPVRCFMPPVHYLKIQDSPGPRLPQAALDMINYSETGDWYGLYYDPLEPGRVTPGCSMNEKIRRSF